MAVKDDKVRKLVTLENDLWKEVEDFRFSARIKTESEAIRRLIRQGLLTLNSDTPILVISDGEEPDGQAH